MRFVYDCSLIQSIAIARNVFSVVPPAKMGFSALESAARSSWLALRSRASRRGFVSIELLNLAMWRGQRDPLVHVLGILLEVIAGRNGSKRI